MNYNERGADPQGGVARYPRVGTESGDPRRFREAIGVLRLIPDAQGPGQKNLKRGHDSVPWIIKKAKIQERQSGKIHAGSPWEDQVKDNHSGTRGIWNILGKNLSIFGRIPPDY